MSTAAAMPMASIFTMGLPGHRTWIGYKLAPLF
jgi:hypothetical protein